MAHVAQQLETLTFNDGPDVHFLVPDGAKDIYRELSEFVLYFWQEVSTGGIREGADFYTLLSKTLAGHLAPTRDHHWRSDIIFFAQTIFLQDNRNKTFQQPSREELKEQLDRNKAIEEQLVVKGLPLELARKEIIQPLDVEATLFKLMNRLEKPHQKMGLWCMGVRHVKQKYGITPPTAPDFGRVIYNKAVRLHLEELGVLRSSPPRPKRPLPVDADGDIDEAAILSNWESDTCTKDCKSLESATSFYSEAHVFIRLISQAEFKRTIRANDRRLTEIYCDEFPELFEFCFGGNSHNDLPEHVRKEWNQMPLPDQTGFVERLRGMATAHHVMGGDLDDAFLRKLNDNIRSGITEPMYNGWARVFQIREKEKNMPLLKMVIQMSYLSMFIQAFRGKQMFEDQTRIAREATMRLQEVCDTNILFTGEGSTMALAPYLL